MSDERAILIAGPTASGKSGLALRLAEQLGGVVINADSMQVYRELSVLTARPSVEEEARAPHALYGFAEGAQSYSAGRYAIDAAAALKDARGKGLRPIIVGGTGLYFKALLDGLSPMPAVPEAVRTRWRGAASEAAPGQLHRLLAERDAEMAARLAPGDTQRIVRALEVIEASGVSLAEWQRRPRERVLDENDTIRLVIDPDRDALARRIGQRFEAMMEAGALEEAQQLAALGLDPTLPVMRAHGVRPLLLHLAGKLGRADAVAASQLETRQYAKRQLTWTRGTMRAWRRLSEKEMESRASGFITFIDH
jgi:tRNA dimethylallyltransferase